MKKTWEEILAGDVVRGGKEGDAGGHRAATMSNAVHEEVRVPTRPVEGQSGRGTERYLSN